jgi:hypothetical protein
MSHPKVVNPAPEFRVDENYHPVNWLRYEPLEDFLEVTQKVRSRFFFVFCANDQFMIPRK